ncbi:hypothetical protein FF38_09101 [Lucilia cuprina]|uniref:Uncharacterized protein n=1 Tax=Lucilia cuprina TaxID=7375 RepID=A0A0L0BUQ6_LUCCU|nr:hypothetical protein FF38_09101 [Lucilia cuprina]
MPNWFSNIKVIEAELRDFSLSMTTFSGVPKDVNNSCNGSFTSSVALDLIIFAWSYFVNLSIYYLYASKALSSKVTGILAESLLDIRPSSPLKRTSMTILYFFSLEASIFFGTTNTGELYGDLDGLIIPWSNYNNYFQHHLLLLDLLMFYNVQLIWF